LHILWELIHESEICFSLEGLHSVMFPVIVKKVFNFGDEVFLQGVSIVESREQSDPLAQVFMLSYLPKRLVVH